MAPRRARRFLVGSRSKDGGTSGPPQRPSGEWHDQWSRFADEADHLFDEWIAP